MNCERCGALECLDVTSLRIGISYGVHRVRVLCAAGHSRYIEVDIPPDPAEHRTVPEGWRSCSYCGEGIDPEREPGVLKHGLCTAKRDGLGRKRKAQLAEPKRCMTCQTVIARVPGLRTSARCKPCQRQHDREYNRRWKRVQAERGTMQEMTL